MARVASTLEEDIRHFLAPGSGSGDGSGDVAGSGSGYGSGSGDGSGDGDGSGSGYGDGSGSGYGYGDGDGSGDGYGDGDGSGDGSGYGAGSGYGDVYGYGDGDGCDYAKGHIVGKDLVLRPCYIARHGDNWAHGDTLREAVRDADAKWMENRPLEDRLADFVKAHPDLDTPYDDLFHWHHVLTGSCEVGRKQWCREHGYEPTDSITVRAFIDQTRFYYGHEAIDKLAELYKTKP